MCHASSITSASRTNSNGRSIFTSRVPHPLLDSRKFLLAIKAEFDQQRRVLWIEIFPILWRAFHQFGGCGQGRSDHETGMTQVHDGV